MGRLVKFKDFLKRSKIPIELNDDETYKRVTIRIKHGGVSLRDTEVGKKIGTKKQFILKQGQFIVSKIDARYGAFGIAPNEVNNAIITGNFWAYDVDFNIIDIDWFNQFTNSQYFYDLCERASSGITHRKYLSEESFLNNELNLPSLDEQKEAIAYINNLKLIGNSISTEINHQLDLIKNLRQAFLREAMQGVLVSNETSDHKTGADLLAEIQAEKAQLVKEKKIKKPKPLAPITEEEIPFDIPVNWTWCRLGEISEIGGGKRVPAGYSLLETPTPHIYLRVSDMKNGSICDNDLRYVDSTVFELIKNYTISSDEIYMTIVGGTIGKCGLIPQRFSGMSLTENAAKISPILVNKLFLYKCLDSPFLQNQFIDKTKQVGVQKMALNRFTSSIIALPPLEIQERIVAKLDVLMGYCDALEEQVKQSQQTNELLLQQVLREALSGKGNAKETQEIQIDREEIKTKPTNVDYYKRTLLAAEIVYQLHKEPTLGHLKLQKLIFLCQRTSDMNLPTNFLRQAMGPYDNQLMRSIDKQLVLKKWFEYSKDTLLKYLPLENAGSHKTDYLKYFSQEDDNIQFIISTFRDKKSEIVELVATIYACLENIKETKSIFSEELLIQKFYDWSEEKKKFKKEEIIKAYSRMQELGIIPQNKPIHF